MLTRTAALALAVLLSPHMLPAQDSIDSLKSKVEQLEAKLSLAEKTIELLQKECSLLEKENAQLKTGASSTPSNPNKEELDPFRVGVVWVGEARVNGNNGKWALSISERNGKDFSGGIVAVGPEGNKTEVPFTGTAPNNGNGLVVIESALVGRAKMFMRGRLSNGEIALALSGTSRLGDKLVGSATLRPKN